MRLRPRTLLLLAAICALDAALLTSLAHRIHEAEAQQAQLAKKYASLQAAVDSLRAQLRDAQANPPQPTPIANIPAGDAKFIPVPVAAIKDMYIPILDHNSNPRTDPIGPWALRLSSDTISWFGLTKDETEKVQKVFSQAQEHIEAHIRATAHEMTDEDSADRDILRKSLVGPGNYSYYAIPPMDDDDVANLQKWMSDGLVNAVGPERADIMTQSLLSQFFWLQKGTRLLIGFSDLDSPPHGTFKNEQKYTTTIYLTIVPPSNESPNQRVLRFSRPVQGNPIPPELGFLFQPATSESSNWRQLAK